MAAPNRRLREFGRRAAPSVVTVIVEEKQISAGQLAAEHASAESSNDMVPHPAPAHGGIGGPEDRQRPTGALGSGLSFGADGLIVTTGTREWCLQDSRSFAATVVTCLRNCWSRRGHRHRAAQVNVGTSTRAALGAPRNPSRWAIRHRHRHPSDWASVSAGKKSENLSTPLTLLAQPAEQAIKRKIPRISAIVDVDSIASYSRTPHPDSSLIEDR